MKLQRYLQNLEHFIAKKLNCYDYMTYYVTQIILEEYFKTFNQTLKNFILKRPIQKKIYFNFLKKI